jgi:hypothetical protein
MLVGWVVMTARVEIEINLGRFIIHLMTQHSIRSPVNINVRDWKVIVSFSFIGEMNVPMDTVQVLKEICQSVGPMGPYDKSSIHVREAADRPIGCLVQHRVLKVLHEKSVNTRGIGGNTTTPSVCS